MTRTKAVYLSQTIDNKSNARTTGICEMLTAMIQPC